MGAYMNALREEGTREEILNELGKQLDLNEAQAARIAEFDDASLETLRVNNELRAKWNDAEEKLAECERESDEAFDRGLATAMEKTYAREIARAKAAEGRNAVLVEALEKIAIAPALTVIDAGRTPYKDDWLQNIARAALSANGDKP